MGLAVVAVLASGVEGELVGLTGGVEVVLAGQLVGVHSLLQNPMTISIQTTSLEKLKYMIVILNLTNALIVILTRRL